MISLFFLKLCLFLNVASLLFCNVFEVDTSFNQPTGYVYLNPGITYANSYAYSQAIALDDQNRIVLAGSGNAPNPANNNIVQKAISVARYLPDGQLDESFNPTGTPGYVVTFVDLHDDGANALAIQSDGKIVVAGYAGSSSNKLMVARYTSQGELDTEFNDTGFYISTVTGEAVYGIAIQPDGKIILIGGTFILFVYRFNSNGTIDTTFGQNGKRSISIPSGYDSAFGRSIVLLKDGSMVGVGYFGLGFTGKMLVLFKLTSTGSVDTTFGNEGFATLILGSSLSCDQVKFDALGKFVIGGGVTNASTGKVEAFVARYTQDGTLDRSFNNGLGYVITPVLDKSLYVFGAIVFDRTPENYPGYGIFYINCYNNDSIAIIKYNYDGSLNLDFANAGIYTKKISKASITTDAVIQDDQKIVVGGRLSENGTENFFAIRFLNNVFIGEDSSLNQTVNFYGYNQSYIYDFLALDMYAEVIPNLQLRNACLDGMNQIIQLYIQAYASQENFNYVLNLNLIIPAILYLQTVLLDEFPDQSTQINSFFSLMLLRIKLLKN